MGEQESAGLRRRRIGCFCLLIIMTALAGCASFQDTAQNEKTGLSVADAGWDSIKLNNAIAGLIAENVFGYTWK